MKIGSIVECIKGFENTEAEYAGFGIRAPKKDGIYTVRHILEVPHLDFIGITVEEIINPIFPYSDIPGEGEPYFFIENFRELVPPMTEEIAELLAEPEYV